MITQFKETLLNSITGENENFFSLIQVNYYETKIMKLTFEHILPIQSFISELLVGESVHWSR